MKFRNYCSLIAGLAFSAQFTLHAQYVNEGFESPVEASTSTTAPTQVPDGWGWTTSGDASLAIDGVTSAIAHSGSQSLFFRTTTTQGAGYESIYLHGTPGGGLSLHPGDQYEASIWVRSDALDPYSGDCIFVVAMEFHDSTQAGNPFEGQGLIFVNPNQMSTDSWTKFSVTASPTAFADNLFFVVKQSNYPAGSYTSSSGAFYVDDLQAMAVPEPGVMALAGLGVVALMTVRRRTACA